MNLRAITLNSSTGLTLRGVIHHPQETVSPGQAAILLPGLIGTRVGPHRLLVDVADRLTKSGMTVLRCDLSGSGYSDGEPPVFDNYVKEVHDMIRYLEAEHGAERFLLGGICRGAKVALAAALQRPQVNDLILFACPRLHEPSMQSKVARRRKHHLKQYLMKSASLNWIRRLVTGDINIRAVGRALLNPVDVPRLTRADAAQCDFELQNLSASVMFVYGERDPDLDDHAAFYRKAFEKKEEPVVLKTVSGSDSAFYSVRWRKEALETVDLWLRDKTSGNGKPDSDPQCRKAMRLQELQAGTKE